METWNLYAHKDEGKFWHVGAKRYVELHMISSLPIVGVVVTSDSEGEYYGWVADYDNTPCMIWPNKKLFDLCFPYGPEIEEKAGKGKIVRLSIREG